MLQLSSAVAELVALDCSSSRGAARALIDAAISLERLKGRFYAGNGQH